MKHKKCNVCHVDKPTSEFYKKGSTLQYRCKQCVKDSIKNNIKYYDDCPECGNQKRIKAKLCYCCSRASRKELYSEELVKKVIDLYQSGLSTWKIAKIIDTNQKRILLILRRNNIEMRENNFINTGRYREKNPRWSGYGSISGAYFISIKRSAKSRNLEFEITPEFLDKLYIKQDKKCALSRLDISLPDSDESRTNGEYTASLDRINPRLGYTENNVQFVHKTVNRIKQNLTEPEFLFLCKKIIDNYDGIIKEVKITTLQQYKKRKKKDVTH